MTSCSQIAFYLEDKKEIIDLFTSKQLTLSKIENFLESYNLPFDIKLSCLPLILINEHLEKKYEKNKNFHSLKNKIKNLIKIYIQKYNTIAFPEKVHKWLVYSTEVSHENLCKLLMYKNCPIDLLETFSKSQLFDLRREVAKNENCPKYILNELINDENMTVRLYCLSNPSISLKDLKEFYNKNLKDYDNYLELSYHTVDNPNCSLEFLEEIFNNYLKKFNYLSFQEKMIEFKNSDVFFKSHSFIFACKAILNHPNSNPELNDKVIQKLLDNIQEFFNLKITKKKNNYYYGFICLIFSDLRLVTQNSQFLNLLLPTTIEKISARYLYQIETELDSASKN